MESERNYKKHSYQKGQKYGRLTLTGKTILQPLYGQNRRMVEADCECGVTRWYRFELLRKGETKSCGCLRRDVTRERATTHGLTQHPLYDVYHAMLKRCYDPRTKQYEDYGGRGIQVCDFWQENFLNFYDWALINGWKEGKSLDRKKNDGNYEPVNCHFTGRAIQNRNTRRNVLLTAFGETKCLFDWGKDSRCVVNVWCLRSRIQRAKWKNIEAAITTPRTDRKTIQRNMKSNKMLTAFGETKCMSAWLEDPRCTVKIDSLRDRLAKGWDHQKAISHPAKIFRIKPNPVI